MQTVWRPCRSCSARFGSLFQKKFSFLVLLTFQVLSVGLWTGATNLAHIAIVNRLWLWRRLVAVLERMHSQLTAAFLVADRRNEKIEKEFGNDWICLYLPLPSTAGPLLTTDIGWFRVLLLSNVHACSAVEGRFVTGIVGALTDALSCCSRFRSVVDRGYRVRVTSGLRNVGRWLTGVLRACLGRLDSGTRRLTGVRGLSGRLEVDYLWGTCCRSVIRVWSRRIACSSCLLIVRLAGVVRLRCTTVSVVVRRSCSCWKNNRNSKRLLAVCTKALPLNYVDTIDKT